MWVDTLSQSDARNILRPLRKGSAPAEHARDLFVGQTPWFKTAVQMMQHTAEDRAFEVRFVVSVHAEQVSLVPFLAIDYHIAS